MNWNCIYIYIFINNSLVSRKLRIIADVEIVWFVVCEFGARQLAELLAVRCAACGFDGYPDK